jgi:hypothetical protein
MESLAERLRNLEQDHARPYLQVAAERLDSPDPRQRAVAVELLSIVPLHTVELGLLPSLGERLKDQELAFAAAVPAEQAQQNQSPDEVRPAFQ